MGLVFSQTAADPLFVAGKKLFGETEFVFRVDNEKINQIYRFSSPEAEGFSHFHRSIKIFSNLTFQNVFKTFKHFWDKRKFI